MSDIEKVRVKKRRGAKYVNFAYYKFKSENLVIIELDMHLKHPEIDGIGGGTDFAPEIYLSSSEGAYFRGEPVSDLDIVVQFPTFMGWDVYTATNVNRYVICIVLTKQEKT